MAKKIALYPGSFDCFTYGHLDIIKRALKIFDELVVAVAVNTSKKTLFSPQERVKILKEILKGYPVKVITFSDLTIKKAKELGVCAIIRGLRVVSDFEYEFQMALANRFMEKDVETIFFMADKEFMYLSSTLVKEIARFGGDVSKFLPEPMKKALVKKLKEEKND